MRLKNNLSLFIVFIFGIFVVRDFFLPGFIPTHDGEYHLIRLWQFDKVLRSGIVFPRWAPDLNKGFGVPLFQFFYPLPNYIGEFFHLMGFSLVDSIKLVLASGLIVSGLTFYLWLRCFFTCWPAVLGAIFYVLAPYHLVDVFIRGSVGEVWALAIAPLTLWTTTKLISLKKKASNKFFVLNNFSSLLLLMSHNILGMMFFVFSFLYGLLLVIWQKKGVFRQLVLNFVLGFFLSSFFWLPVIFEKKYIIGLEIINYEDHFPALFQLIFPSWGSGFSVSGITDQLSFQIGLPHLFILFSVLGLILFHQRRNVLLIFFVGVSFLTIFFMLEVSNCIWKMLPLMKYFQYPWRLLSLTILTISFLPGFLVQKKAKIFILALALVAFFFYLPYIKPVVYKPRKDSFYLGNPIWTEGTATLGDTFNTIWFRSPQEMPKRKIELVSGQGKITKLKIAPTKYQFTVQADSGVNLKANTAYFPGWTAIVDNQEATVDYNNGLINFSVPEGKHDVIVSLRETRVRKIADLISLASFVFLILLSRPK